jgi:hypothetical protein
MGTTVTCHLMGHRIWLRRRNWSALLARGPVQPHVLYHCRGALLAGQENVSRDSSSSYRESYVMDTACVVAGST